MEKIIAWDEKYNTGCPEIDRQHRGLFDIINKLSDKLHSIEKDDIVDILNDLYKYTDEHFRTEEELFEKSSFPNAKEHKLQHKEFINKVAEFTSKFEKEDAMLTFDILFFLKDWILEHILYSDREYVEYVCK